LRKGIYGAEEEKGLLVLALKARRGKGGISTEAGEKVSLLKP
jgi:hypothetical protein